MDCCSTQQLSPLITDSSSNLSQFDCLLFDLDDTLYSSKTGIAASVRKNIEDFLIEKCGFPQDQASTLRVELFKTYGSTLAGLRVLEHDITAEEYHSFVHGRLPYDRIKPDYQLRKLLLTITQRKIIFTNSDKIHAMKVLNKLGLEDCFEQIVCFETLNPDLPTATRPDEFPIILKPSLDAIKIAIDAAQIIPQRTLFLDDSVRNVAAGKALGLHTVLVGKSTKSAEADYALETVNILPKVIPEIWINNNNKNKIINNPTHDQQQQQQIQKIRRTRSDIDTNNNILTNATANTTMIGA